MNLPVNKVCFAPLIALSAVALLPACSAEKADAPRTPVIAEPIRSFAATDIILKSNRIFLWKVGVKPEIRAKASEISKEIDKYDELAAPLVRRQETIEKIEELEPWFKARNQLEMSVKNRDRYKQQKQDEEKKTNPDPKKLQDLAKRIDKAEKDIQNKQSEISRLARSTNPALCEEYTGNAAHLDEILKTGKDQVDLITQIVAWSDPQPASISFNFDADGNVQKARIEGWRVPEESNKYPEATFSTEDATPTEGPTIQNVRFETQGGRLTFDVLVYAPDNTETRELREIFHFDIRRANYKATDEKGRIGYAGEVNRERNPEYCQRRFNSKELADQLADCLLPREGWAKMVNVIN